MINDVLEQMTEDYLRHLGYFTQHNIKYRPNRKGPAFAVNSDIDIIGVHPRKKGIGQVVVVSCKSWHGGLHIQRDLKRIKTNFKRTRKIYREFCNPIWSAALKKKVKEVTGQNKFTVYLACVSYNINHKNLWEENRKFLENLRGCKIKLIDFKSMIETLHAEAKGITPAHSELLRLLQFIYHSGGDISYEKGKGISHH